MVGVVELVTPPGAGVSPLKVMGPPAARAFPKLAAPAVMQRIVSRTRRSERRIDSLRPGVGNRNQNNRHNDSDRDETEGEQQEEFVGVEARRGRSQRIDEKRPD